MNIVELKLTDINPNINGIYYDIDSYNKSISSILYNNLVSSCYMFEKNISENNLDTEYVIGKIINIDVDKRLAKLSVNDEWYEIINKNNRNFRLGFSMNCECIKDNLYKIKNILYSVIIDVSEWELK